VDRAKLLAKIEEADEMGTRVAPKRKLDAETLMNTVSMFPPDISDEDRAFVLAELRRIAELRRRGWR
jgi:hypothetical protein